ncbi:redoxin domain-containing protein [Flavobacteriaceae bacterium R38]|nr:redoxin domain-containing protein [Flavobacteriaceae bacterium R38]
MKTHVTFILLFALLFISCQKQQNGFEITANLDGFPENSKVIVSDISSQKILDSTQITDGKFVAKGFLDDEPANVRVVIISNDGKEQNLNSIFIGNENISIVGDKVSFNSKLEVNGSQHNGFKNALDEKINPLYNKRDKKLQEMFKLRNNGEWNDSLQDAYWSKTGIMVTIDNKISEITQQFIANNINSHYALFQLTVYKNDFSKEFIRTQLNKLNSDFKNTKYADVLNTFLDNEPLKAGSALYDFQAENQNGQLVNFSSLLDSDKEYTLLEFYSPHCGWCKKALPEIKKLEKTENKKLQVITYNVDKSKEDWLNDSKSNGITWTTLWNKDGRYSDAYTKYQINGTPTYFLFDKQGKVLKRWSGFDEKLIESIKNNIQ